MIYYSKINNLLKKTYIDNDNFMLICLKDSVFILLISLKIKNLIKKLNFYFLIKLCIKCNELYMK